MTAKENVELASDTAEVLLTAIKNSATSAQDPGSLETLARAYSLVRESMPKQGGTRVGHPQ